MNRKIVYILAIVAVVGCRRPTGDNGPVLCVSIEPQRQLLEQLAGDDYDIVTIMGRGDDPESYEPTMQQRMAISDARAYFTTGQLPFEERLVSSAGTGTMVVDTSAGIEMVTGTHCHGNGQGSDVPDPHIWSSIANAKVIARNMARTLAQLNPDSSDVYEQRYRQLATRLDSIDGVVRARLDSAGVHAFAIWHPSLSYYARDYGLHQIAVSQENKELSVSDIRNIIDQSRAEGVEVFFYQSDLDSRQALTINSQIGSRLVDISPMSYDWLDQIISITDVLAR